MFVADRQRLATRYFPVRTSRVRLRHFDATPTNAVTTVTAAIFASIHFEKCLSAVPRWIITGYLWADPVIEAVGANAHKLTRDKEMSKERFYVVVDAQTLRKVCTLRRSLEDVRWAIWRSALVRECKRR